MAITAQSVIDKTRIILQDADKVRWTDDELLGWLNEGQREITVYKPDAYVVNESLNLVAGTKQSLPSGGLTLIDVIKNGTGRAVRHIDMRILDDQIPAWHSVTASTNVTNYMFDGRNQKNFYVYPPAASGATLDIVYAKSPTDILSDASILVDDVYSSALMDYVLHRAYSKDVDYAADDNRANAHYQKFVAAMAGKEAGETATEATALLRRANRASAQMNAMPQGQA